MGRLIGTTTQYSFLAGQLTQSFAYDAASNRTSATQPDGSTNTYLYDSSNRLTDLTSSWAGHFGFGYDALSRRTGLSRPNNIITSYSYDSLSRLLSVLHQAGGVTVDGASYVYDNAGTRTSKQNLLNGVTEGYTYDLVYQLTQVVQGANTTESYSYDSVGNRLSSLGLSPYAYNSSNQLTSTPNATFTYDNNGNTLTKTDSSGVTSYAWDYENRLTSVTLPGTGGTVTFKYDPFGRRIQKIGLSGATNYAYDGANVVSDLDATGTVLARYAQGSGIDEPLGSITAAGTVFFEADGLGSITSLTDAAGVFGATYTFDAFGNLTAWTGAAQNRFRYTAREFDQDTGLYYYRARYYDPAVGRFISEDPIGPAGQNLFSYVYNSPTGHIDPSGLFTIVNKIKLRREIDLDYACTSGGACTTGLYENLSCDCACDGSGWKAAATLTLYGTLHVYNGPFPYKHRTPKDKKVRDADSAIAHEYYAHIDVAVAAVTPIINALEARKFSSKENCEGECRMTAGVVRDTFNKALEESKAKEAGQ